MNRLSALVLLFFTECNLYGMKTCLIQVCGRVVPRTRHIQTWKNSDCEQTCPCQVHSGISCFIIKIRPWSPYPFQLLLLWVAARFRLGLGSDPVASGEDSLSDDSMILYRSRLSTIGNRDLMVSVPKEDDGLLQGGLPGNMETLNGTEAHLFCSKPRWCRRGHA